MQTYWEMLNVRCRLAVPYTVCYRPTLSSSVFYRLLLTILPTCSASASVAA